MADREIELLAREIAKLKRSVAGLAQTRQVSRTIVNDVELGDTVLEAQEVAFIVDEHSADLDFLDDGTGLYEADTAQDAADAAHEAKVRVVEAEAELEAARAELDEKLHELESSLTEADGRITAAKQRADDAFGVATAASGDASEAAQAASDAQTAADDAKDLAVNAATAASSALGQVGDKSTVLIQSTAPFTQFQVSSTLWIDTTGGANTPKRWNGSDWIEVADKAARDAAALAVQAAADAAEAQSAAGTAQSNASAALTMAGTKSRVYYSTAAPSGTATAVGDLWRRRDLSQNIIAEWFWDGSGWVATKVSSDAIANLDVGKLTVGTGIISDLVAQNIAARTATFMELNVDRLVATGTATIAAAVIEKLYTDVVKAKLLTVTEKIIANDIFAAGVVSASALASNAIDGKVITGALIRTAASGQRVQIDTVGIRAFNSSGSETAVLTATDGGLRLTGFFEMRRGTGGSNPWAYISENEFGVSEQQSGGGSYAHVRPFQVATDTSVLPASANYTRGGAALRGGGPNGGGSPGLDIYATSGASMAMRASSTDINAIVSNGNLNLRANASNRRVYLYGGNGIYLDGATTFSEWPSFPGDSAAAALPGFVEGGFSIVTASFEVRGGTLFISLNVTGNITQGSGVDVWNSLPARLRPSSNRQAAAWLNGGYAGVAWVRSNGTIAVANQTGATRTSAQFTVSYPYPG
ncbi:hypothetical protein [Leucobacter musarum]|uniref:hypothetical protein n=1 Tax=Leucobacter musarum TaxID=1930747 RepID=UPI0006A775FF|nr:hypothetical protein [Leucobacter musarum]